MKLKPLPLGVSLGLVWGLIVFIATIMVMIEGGGNTLNLLSNFYFGYQVSWLGSIIGLIYGFVDGFIVGAVIALIYNALSGSKD